MVFQPLSRIVRSVTLVPGDGARKVSPSGPEKIARDLIGRMLAAGGWIVQDYADMNIAAGRGVAIREFPLRSGFADYLLYADQRAIGVIEAKANHHTLTGVEIQSAKYVAGLPAGLPAWRLPLPFAYESTGEVTQFTSARDPDPRGLLVPPPRGVSPPRLA